VTRILVAGIGNIFNRDDGFGVEMAARLRARSWPEGVIVADFGIRGIHLAYEMLDGDYALVVLVDACRTGGPPGTLGVIAPERAEEAGGASLDAHGLDPESVLRLLDTLGGVRPRVLVVGCEPGDLDEGLGLSPPVAAAMSEAVTLVEALVYQEVAAHVSGHTGTGDRALG